MPTLIEVMRDVRANPERYAEVFKQPEVVPGTVDSMWVFPSTLAGPRGSSMSEDVLPFARSNPNRNAVVGEDDDRVYMLNLDSIRTFMPNPNLRSPEEAMAELQAARGYRPAPGTIEVIDEAPVGPRICNCGYTSMFTGEIDAHLERCEQAPARQHNTPNNLTATGTILDEEMSRARLVGIQGPISIDGHCERCGRFCTMMRQPSGRFWCEDCRREILRPRVITTAAPIQNGEPVTGCHGCNVLIPIRIGNYCASCAEEGPPSPEGVVGMRSAMRRIHEEIRQLFRQAQSGEATDADNT